MTLADVEDDDPTYEPIGSTYSIFIYRQGKIFLVGAIMLLAGAVLTFGSTIYSEQYAGNFFRRLWHGCLKGMSLARSKLVTRLSWILVCLCMTNIPFTKLNYDELKHKPTVLHAQAESPIAQHTPRPQLVLIRPLLPVFAPTTDEAMIHHSNRVSSTTHW